jgi:hypothetical protein
MGDEDKSKVIVTTTAPTTETKAEGGALVIPDEAKAMAAQIISEAVKLIPQGSPSGNVAVNADMSAVLRKLDTIEKNLYVVFCIVEKILAEVGPTPEEFREMARTIDKKVLKERAKNGRPPKEDRA